MGKEKKKCEGCGKVKTTVARGLCWRCYTKARQEEGNPVQDKRSGNKPKRTYKKRQPGRKKAADVESLFLPIHTALDELEDFLAGVTDEIIKLADRTRKIRGELIKAVGRMRLLKQSQRDTERTPEL